MKTLLRTSASKCILLAVFTCYSASGKIFTQPSGNLDLESYCTKIRLGKNIEVSLYSTRMFRVRTSALVGEKFPPEYEIPFVIGKLENWDSVPFKQWKDGKYNYIETDVIQIKIPRRGNDWTVWTNGGEKKIYPSKGLIHGIFRDGYTVFDNASAFDERNNNNHYTHWFYNPSTGRYVDTYLHADLIYDQYFIYGPDYQSLFSQLNELLGPEPLLPLKAYGAFHMQHLICEGNQEQLLAYARKLRERDLPCDVLIVADEWGDGCPGGIEKYWGQLEWYEEYTKPLSVKDMCDSLEAMHFDLMTIHHSAPNFPHRKLDTPRRVRDWTSMVYDEAYWWSKMEEQIDWGVDGTWQDTRQNDITDGVIWTHIQEYIGPERRVLFNGSSKMMEFNPWEYDRDNSINANDLIGSRRYPFRWTGDIDNSYNELKFQINAITNQYGSMKGVSYITCDDFGKDWKVHARWNQFLDFLPVSRTHMYRPWQFILSGEEWNNLIKQEGYKYLEDSSQFRVDGTHNPMTPLNSVQRKIMEDMTNEKTYKIKTAENSIRKHRKLRYQLLPYIYSTAYENYSTGMSICRPMLLAFPEDYRCKQNMFPYQYMFGEWLLVAPVYGDFNTMEIYLPKGYNWIDYWDKRVYKGGQMITYNTSYTEQLPLFVRSGAIIPMRKDQNWIETGEIWDPLILDIYPDSTSEFLLYEDDKRTTYYQMGEFSKTAIRCLQDPSKIEIKIGRSMGDYKGQPESRKLSVRVNLIREAPSEIMLNSTVIQKNDKNEALDVLLPVWYYDKDKKTLVVTVLAESSKEIKIEIIKN